MKFLKKDGIKVDEKDRETWPKEGDLCIIWPFSKFNVPSIMVLGFYNGNINEPIWKWNEDYWPLVTGDLYTVLDLESLKEKATKVDYTEDKTFPEECTFNLVWRQGADDNYDLLYCKSEEYVDDDEAIFDVPVWSNDFEYNYLDLCEDRIQDGDLYITLDIEGF